MIPLSHPGSRGGGFILPLPPPPPTLRRAPAFPICEPQRTAGQGPLGTPQTPHPRSLQYLPPAFLHPLSMSTQPGPKGGFLLALGSILGWGRPDLEWQHPLRLHLGLWDRRQVASLACVYFFLAEKGKGGSTGWLPGKGIGGDKGCKGLDERGPLGQEASWGCTGHTAFSPTQRWAPSASNWSRLLKVPFLCLCSLVRPARQLRGGGGLSVGS